jgi:Cu-processing system permease protein
MVAARRKGTDMHVILTIARQELLINIRNKWTVIFAVVFGTLVVGISCFGIMAEGFSGTQNFTRTSASLLNLVLYIVPLVALTMGTLSFTGDKGSMELLFSQPVSRTQVAFGKFLGVFTSMTLSTLIGFAAAGIVIVASTGAAGILRYASFVLLSLLLALVFLSIAVLVATATGRKAKAFGLALFLWFFFVLLYDLLALGGTMMLRGRPANVFLFLSLLGNPVDMVRVASLILLDNVAIFGSAGAALLRFFGGGAASLALLLAMLALWIVLPLAGARRLLGRQDI